jgi:hypothetical protein
MPPDRTSTIAHAIEIVNASASGGVITRVMGGVGIALHCPSSEQEPFLRDYGDIDLIVDRRGARKHVEAILRELEYEPDVEFNTINGPEGRRQYRAADGRKLDVFVGTFRMCHELPLEKRLAADAPTVAPADLFLTKAQIVEMTSKDFVDLACLLLDHELADHDQDCINRERIAEVTSTDWGLWRTVSISLDHIVREIPTIGVSPEQVVTIEGRAGALHDVLHSAPKSTRWKLRARVGERKRWYELPEDPERTGAGPATIVSGQAI